MAKRILIDSSFGIVRTAIAEDSTLLDYYEESPEHARTKGNVYKGIIKRVDPNIQAAFVRYGASKDGFLPLRDLPSKSGAAGSSLNPGDAVIVQVLKDEVGNKGAALTTKISLSGRFLVYLPGKQGTGGISSRVTEDDRAALKKIKGDLVMPPGGAVILRTAALNHTLEELQGDLDRLDASYNEILEAASAQGEPGLLYRDAPPALRYLREYLTPDVERIWVNQAEVLEQCRQFFALYEPEAMDKVALSPEGSLLFQRFGLEDEIEKLSARKVVLPSGANIVIDQAEALVAIDVNSAKSKIDPAAPNPDPDSPSGNAESGGSSRGALPKRGRSPRKPGNSGKGMVTAGRAESSPLAMDNAESMEGEPMTAEPLDETAETGEEVEPGEERQTSRRRRHALEDTAFAINKEAASEVARQLRLRDLGGIIIVDFIDMEEDKHRRQVEEVMRKALAGDKAKVKVYDISPLGIMQISRQRLRMAGPHFAHSACDACHGMGWHVSPAASAMTLLRKLEERLRARKVSGINITAPYPLANELSNGYRPYLAQLEVKFGCRIRVLAEPTRSGEATLSIFQADSGSPRGAAEGMAKSPRLPQPRRKAPERNPDPALTGAIAGKPRGQQGGQSLARAVEKGDRPHPAQTASVPEKNGPAGTGFDNPHPDAIPPEGIPPRLGRRSRRGRGARRMGQGPDSQPLIRGEGGPSRNPRVSPMPAKPVSRLPLVAAIPENPARGRVAEGQGAHPSRTKRRPRRRSRKGGGSGSQPAA